MTYNFTLDGLSYPQIGIGSIKRMGEVREDNTGGETMSGLYRRGIVGTYYHYDMTLYTDLSTPSVYDALYQVLTSPQAYHYLTAPYGQTTLTLKIYVESVSDDVLYMDDKVTKWGGLYVSFIAAEPARAPT